MYIDTSSSSAPYIAIILNTLLVRPRVATRRHILYQHQHTLTHTLVYHAHIYIYIFKGNPHHQTPSRWTRAEDSHTHTSTRRPARKLTIYIIRHSSGELRSLWNTLTIANYNYSRATLCAVSRCMVSHLPLLCNHHTTDYTQQFNCLLKPAGRRVQNHVGLNSIYNDIKYPHIAFA